MKSPPWWGDIEIYWRSINDSLSSTAHFTLILLLNTTELGLIDPKSRFKETFSLIIGAVTSTMKPFDDASENNPKEKSLHV